MNKELKVTANGPEIILREGDAQKIFDPREVKIAGNIEAPGEFFTKRWELEIKALKDVTNVVVDVDNLSIVLTVNETNHFAKVISGKMEFDKDFLEFNINRNKQYSVRGLYQMLRLKRAFFKNREQHASILDELKKFEAKTEIEFKSTNDFKGSVAMQKIQTCKTNLSYEFNLNIPIYKGLNAFHFPVEIEFEPDPTGSIVCWLISEDLAELEIKARDTVMNDQIKIFMDKEVVIIKK